MAKRWKKDDGTFGTVSNGEIPEGAEVATDEEFQTAYSAWQAAAAIPEIVDGTPLGDEQILLRLGLSQSVVTKILAL